MENRQATLFENTIADKISADAMSIRSLISIETMGNDEMNAELHISYTFQKTDFGKIIVGSTDKGICYIAFTEDEEEAVKDLSKRFEAAIIERKQNSQHQQAVLFFNKDQNNLPEIKVHLKGTTFQVEVWKALLLLPFGSKSSYNKIAEQIGKPKASRAVGTAIGKNPIAFIIPCHRVVQTNGQLGGYMWGIERKAAILRWEFENKNT
jgi:AraC family transcriptional regulator of adaptative response/methylated-DNA-[protein]-cysteine methyltransferase